MNTLRPLRRLLFAPHPPLRKPFLLRKPLLLRPPLRTFTAAAHRYNSSTQPPEPAVPRPSYEITFTCRRCSTRSTHTISKQAYHYGTLLIQCPGCQNRHVITDHLCIFNEKSKSLEDLLQERGEILKKGIKHPDGDIELFPEQLQEEDVKSVEDLGGGEESEKEGEKSS